MSIPAGATIDLGFQGTKNKFVSVEAKNGNEALELVRSEKPDLVLLDVDMGPGPNGFDVCRQIKADDATKDIPVVMLTAHESDSDRAIGFAAGATQYLTKPFGPLELIDTIRGILALGALLVGIFLIWVVFSQAIYTATFGYAPAGTIPNFLRRLFTHAWRQQGVTETVNRHGQASHRRIGVARGMSGSHEKACPKRNRERAEERSGDTR